MRLDDLTAATWTPHRLRLFSENSSPGRVLDYGCYNGYITRLLAERGWEGWGIDSNREFIQLAEDLTRQQGMQECCHFSQVAVDAPQLPFEKGFFDAVFSSEVIEHVPNVSSFLWEIKRILRRDGTLFLTTPNGVSWRHLAKNLLWFWNPERRLREIESWPSYLPGKEGHLYYWDVWTLYRLLHINGFRYVAHDYTEIHRPFRTLSELVHPLRPLRTGFALVLRHAEPEQFYL
jgi:SAM-dependent methyltransferase